MSWRFTHFTLIKIYLKHLLKRVKYLNDIQMFTLFQYCEIWSKIMWPRLRTEKQMKISKIKHLDDYDESWTAYLKPIICVVKLSINS